MSEPGEEGASESESESSPPSPSTETTHPPRPPRARRQTDFDEWIMVVGVNGSGKSTYARSLSIELVDRGYRLFIHDPNDDYVGIAAAFRSPEEWRKEASAAYQAKQAFPRAASFPDCQADVVLQLARQSAQVRGAPPSIFIADEGVLVRGANRHRLGELFADTIARRRHLRCGAVMLIQHASQVHYEVRSLATRVVLFRLGSERDVDALLEANVPESWCRKALTLRRGEFLDWHKGMQFQ